MSNVKKIFESLVNTRMYTIQTLNKGLTNNSYLVNNTYFFSMKKKKMCPFYNPYNEIIVAEDLAPTHIDFYCKARDLKGNKVTIYEPLAIEFVPSKCTKNQLEKIANAFITIHNTKTRLIDEFNYLDRLKFYRSYVFDQVFDKNLDKQVKQNAKKYFANCPKVLCHNNVDKLNIVFIEDQIRIIDFEDACLNDPMFDLVTFLSNCNITSYDQITTLLKCYYKNSYNKYLYQKAIDYYQMIDYINYYKYMTLYLISKDDEFILKADDCKGRLEEIYNFPLKKKKTKKESE